MICVLKDLGGGSCMEILYNSKGIDNYLNVSLGDISDRKNIGVEYKTKMLQENNIPCLIKPVAIEEDGQLWLKYNINSVYVLERLFSYVRPDGSLLRIIFGQLINLIDTLEKFFLLSEELVIDPEYMFYDGEKKEVRLLYIPGYNKNIGMQLKGFLEYIMKIFDHRDREGVSFMYQVYELVSGDKFSLEALRKYFVNKENAVSYKEISKANSCQEEKKEGTPANYENTFEKKTFFEKDFTWHEPVFVINGIFIFVFLVKYFAFGKHDIDIFVGILLTIAMIIHGLFYVGKDEAYDVDEDMTEHFKNLEVNQSSSEYKPAPVEMAEITSLIPLTNGALNAIELNKAEAYIVVGRGKKESHYRLPTTQISRAHASIYKNSEGVFVRDEDSTNGTFVNSKRINPLEKVKINRGDIISFANEEFYAS